MGVPAGFKLNHAFNTMLGKFFLYHINLWWTFLVVARPLLELVFRVFLLLGRVGITCQVCILGDLLALVSFHVYCVYVYAARLYHLQLRGLVALFRLFLGRKRNPLRRRIDSCRYSTNQLFMGTLAFTILLFLLPTTLMYYVVFAGLRVAIVGLGGLLARVRYLVEVLPLYATILWLFGSATVGRSVQWTVRAQARGGPLTVCVRVVPGSWRETAAQCVPDPARPPAPVAWLALLQDLLVGRLIYPV
ncbi:phosphatidylinositol N-acetylglucosaminyltransferase subunit Q [Bacillus rossius redtenbacheri]|uniref:phosphatidylinositol N-acetylglucosaminyltransferase subunit Q n=1 Tax=Bacillus rossius redtenbacheri TaxID=93214 RepID=UPI002FDE03D3